MEAETKWTQFSRRHFQMVFFNENVWISIEVSLKFVPKGPINNIPALVQIMAWRRQGDKPLSETIMVNLLTHISVTRPQWVKLSVCTFRYLAWIVISGIQSVLFNVWMWLSPYILHGDEHFRSNTWISNDQWPANHPGSKCIHSVTRKGLYTVIHQHIHIQERYTLQNWRRIQICIYVYVQQTWCTLSCIYKSWDPLYYVNLSV